MLFNLGEYLEGLIVDMRRTNPRLSASMEKWKYILYKRSSKVATVTKVTQEEAIHKLLVPLVRIDATYHIPQYRYEGSLYDFIERDEDLLHLMSSPFNLRNKQRDFWIKEGEVEKVHKSSYDSLIYTKIEQESKVLMRLHHTQRNGYVVVGKVLEFLPAKGEKILISKKVAPYDHVSLDAELHTYSGEPTSMHDMVGTDPTPTYILEILNELSPQSQEVALTLMDNPGIPNTVLSKLTGLSKRVVEVARREIRIELKNYLIGERVPVQVGEGKARCPIHFKASVVR